MSCSYCIALITKRTNKTSLQVIIPNPKNGRFDKIGHKVQILFFGQKEKENLFSVRGFETETSNFALNGCLRVSKNPKFHARSKKIQIDSQHTVNKLKFPLI